MNLDSSGSGVKKDEIILSIVTKKENNLCRQLPYALECNMAP